MNLSFKCLWSSPCSISHSLSAMCSKSCMMERPARWWKVSFHSSSWTFSSRSRPFRKGWISKTTSHFAGFPHSSPDTTALQSPLCWLAVSRSGLWVSCGVSAWHNWCPYPSVISQEGGLFSQHPSKARHLLLLLTCDWICVKWIHHDSYCFLKHYFIYFLIHLLINFRFCSYIKKKINTFPVFLKRLFAWSAKTKESVLLISDLGCLPLKSIFPHETE